MGNAAGKVPLGPRPLAHRLQAPRHRLAGRPTRSAALSTLSACNTPQQRLAASPTNRESPFAPPSQFHRWIHGKGSWVGPEFPLQFSVAVPEKQPEEAGNAQGPLGPCSRGDRGAPIQRSIEVQCQHFAEPDLVQEHFRPGL